MSDVGWQAAVLSPNLLFRLTDYQVRTPYNSIIFPCMMMIATSKTWH